MKGSMDYLIGQVLSLIFYIMTLIVYYRARKEYVGGKIAAAIKLIMIFLAILFVADFADYFLIIFLPLGRDSILIIKILLKLLAICVLFFGGLRFFVSQRSSQEPGQQPAIPVRPDAALAPASLPDDSKPVSAPSDRVDRADRRKPTLGRYEILEQIGRGAMGIVYKGHDPKLNRLTAIKTIRFMDEFDDEQAEVIREHFYHEAEVVARLSHPNIVTIYDVGEDLDLSYLAMEYLEGQGLDNFTKAGHLLPLGECLDLIIQVCDALAYAHDHDIIHRDIKPENIMVLKDGTVKVTDFGIARIATSTKTRTGVIKGTPYYMSPEQTKGLKLTGPSDIFSLGVVFYQLLTGHLPFTGENMAAIMYQTTSVDPEPPTTFNPSLDPSIVKIISRALDKQLATRYQSARQMGDDLRRARRKVSAPESRRMETIPGRLPEAEGPEDLKSRADADFVTLETLPPMDRTAPGQDGIEFDGVRLEMASKETGEARVPETGAEPPVSEHLKPGWDRSFRAAARGPVGAEESGAPAMERLHPHTIDWEYDTEREAGQTADEIHFTPELTVSKETKWVKIRENLFSRITTVVMIGSFTAIALAGVYYLLWHPSGGFDPRGMQSEPSAVPAPTTSEQELHAKLERQKAETQALQAKQEREKQAEQERLAQEEKAKQAEQERLERLEQAKQAERERLARIEQAKRAEQERLERLEQAKQAERERLLRLEQEKLARLQQAESDAIAQLVAEARGAWQRQEFARARTYYEEALQKVVASAFRSEAPFSAYKREIEAALKNDDMVFGPQGYIKYRGQWMAPQAYEATRFQEGYVRYRGELIHHSRLSNTIERLTYPDVNTFLTLRYKGQRIHTKNIQLRQIELKSSTDQASVYNVFYDWEAWTFNDLGKGSCALEIAYDVAKDNWRIMKGCE